MAVHNLSDSGTSVTVPVTGKGLADRLSPAVYAADDDGTATLALEPYGFRWLREVEIV